MWGIVGVLAAVRGSRVVREDARLAVYRLP
jgi:hypothetical protein